jgi:hypothetical protein
MNNWDELASAGRDRYQTLLDEAAEARLARRVAAPRPTFRGRVAAVLTALSLRSAPAAEAVTADATR